MSRLLCLLGLLAVVSAAAADDLLPATLRGDAKLAGIVEAFAQGYGPEFRGAAVDATGRVLLRFAHGEFTYDDGQTKTFPQLLEQPDVEDQFAQVYPLRNPTETLPVNFDPGRVRVEALFKALYGASEEEVARSCETVDFCGHRVKFTTRCGAAAALAEVSKELTALFAKRPELRVYIEELGGTQAWRFIAGTHRLSNHSFGNAIDLNVKKSAYWRWEPAERLSTFSHRGWPVEIIEAFERHGFIWGGKWYHFDTMHFEYRPELIAYARAHPAEPRPGPPGDEARGK